MTATKEKVSASRRAKQLIRKSGGIVRTSEALKAGIHPRTLYALRDSGALESLSRGVYRLTGQPPISHPDLVTVATRCPQAVICLVSALSFHELTTQVPHAVSIALIKGAEQPRIDYPPLSVHRFSKGSYTAGIEQHEIDGVPVRVYNPEKTLADCFKFRSKIGMDIVLEALRLYRERRKFRTDKLLEYARVCRVHNVMRPYLEAAL